MKKSGTQEASENKIKDAFTIGMAHGRENNYAPPLWMHAHPVLHLTAYRNGFAEGLKVYRAAMAVGVK